MSTVINNQQVVKSERTNVTILPTTIIIYARRDDVPSYVVAGVFGAVFLFCWIYMIVKHRDKDDDKYVVILSDITSPKVCRVEIRSSHL